MQLHLFFIWHGFCSVCVWFCVLGIRKNSARIHTQICIRESFSLSTTQSHNKQSPVHIIGHRGTSEGCFEQLLYRQSRREGRLSPDPTNDITLDVASITQRMRKNNCERTHNDFCTYFKPQEKLFGGKMRKKVCQRGTRTELKNCLAGRPAINSGLAGRTTSVNNVLVHVWLSTFTCLRIL